MFIRTRSRTRDFDTRGKYLKKSIHCTLGGSTRCKIIAKKALKPVELALWPKSTEWGNHPLYDYDIGKWGFLEGEVVRNPEITNPWAIKHHFAVFLSTAFRFAQRLSFCVGFLVARGQRIIWHNLTKPNLTYLAVLAVLDLPKCATNVQMVRDLLVAVLDLTQVHH